MKKYKAYSRIDRKIYRVLHIYWVEDYKYTETPTVLLEDNKAHYPKYKVGSDVEIMEYIGLKDIDGQEIYQHQILKEPDGRLYIIVWADDEARFELESLADHTLRHIKDVKIMKIIGDKFHADQIKV